MSISRRSALLGATAAVVAGVPIAVRAADPEEQQLLTVFRQLSDDRRALMHDMTRHMAGLPGDPELKRRWGYVEPDGESRP